MATVACNNHPARVKITMVAVDSVSAGRFPANMFLWYPSGGQEVYFLPEQGIEQNQYTKKV
jgi:hypothetical protein